MKLKKLLSKCVKMITVFVLTFVCIGNIMNVSAETMTSNSVVAGTGPDGEGPAEMILQKSVDNSEYKVGDIITYKVSLTCMKALKYKNIVIEDTMPEGVKLLSDSFKWSYTSGSYTYSESVFAATFGAPEIVLNDNSFSFSCMTTANHMQGNNAHLDFTYQVQIVSEELAGKPLTNTATLHFNQEPDEKARVSTTVDILPLPKAVLSIDKTVDKDIVDVGDTVKYTIKANQTNEELDAKEVVITDLIPRGLEVNKDDILVTGIDDYTVTLENYRLIVTTPSLAYGQEVIITYTAKVLEGYEGKDITNVASVEAVNADKVEDAAMFSVNEKVEEEVPPVEEPTVPTNPVDPTPDIPETPTEKPGVEVVPSEPSNEEETILQEPTIENSNKANTEVETTIVNTNDFNTYTIYVYTFLLLGSFLGIKKMLSMK